MQNRASQRQDGKQKNADCPHARVYENKFSDVPMSSEMGRVFPS